MVSSQAKTEVSFRTNKTGRDGDKPVSFVCPAPAGATLTFEFRLWPSADHPGSIDPGHKGPCAVYVKKVDDIFSDPAAGPGWIKIWEDGYDKESREWCVDRLIQNKGLLSVELPNSLPSGYYLVRPEVLALHQAYRGDPQYYLGCAQLFIQGGPVGSLDVADKYKTSIPGYVDGDTPGVTFDIYKDPMPNYPIPGPKVYVPAGKGLSTIAVSHKEDKMRMRMGAVPSDCILKNANWCARPIAKYSGQDACWKGVKDCYDQSKLCWATAPASGSENCYTWSDYCKEMDQSCERGEFEGPPAFEGKEKYAAVPGDIPQPWDIKAADTEHSEGSDNSDEKGSNDAQSEAGSEKSEESCDE